MKTLKSTSARWGISLVLALVSFGVAGFAQAAPLNSPAMSAKANVITVRAQDTNNGQVLVDSVTAAQDGWLLIRKDANGMPGAVLGFAAVHQGSNTGVSVDIRTTSKNGNDDLTPTLWAELVADPNALTPYASPDFTVEQAGGVAMATFSSTFAGGAVLAVALASQVPTTGGLSSKARSAVTNRIVVHAQDTNNGQVLVDSVTAAQDGWLLIRKDANGMPGAVLGFAAVHQGSNTGVSVDIRTTSKKGNDDLTPTLWAELVADSNALTPYASPDFTVEQSGGAAMATFSSTFAGGAAQ